MPHISLRTRSLLLLALAAALSSCENPAGSGGDPGTAARLDVVSGDLQTGPVDAELPQPLVVRVVDDKGKPVSGQVVNFRVLAGGGSVFAGAAVTNDDGEARERWTLGTVAGDTQRVEARAVDAATGTPLVFATFRAVGQAGAPAAITPMGESVRTGTAGMPLGDSLAVRVLDRFGNGVAGATVVWTVRRGGGSVSPSPSTADAQGVARAQWTMGTFVDSTQVADAAAAVGISTSFVASTGVPSGAQLVVRAGSGQTATVGALLPQPVKVALLLADGRPVVGAVIAWSLGSSGGSVTPATSVTDASGEATAQWTLPTVAGTASLWAETPGAMGVSFAATATPGPAVSLTRVSGNGQVPTAGVPLADSLVVRAEDAHGNGVPGVAVTWATSNGTFSPATTTTRADGTARSRWTPASASLSSATATAAGLPPVTFTTQSQNNVSITFYQPGQFPVITDTMQVQVGVQSLYALTSVVATVGDRSVPLANTLGSTTWSGRLSLVGVPRGTYTLRITATDASGVVTEGTRTFDLDRLPTFEFRTPARGAVVSAGSPVRVVVVCRDDGPAGCVSSTLYRTVNGYNLPIVSGGDSLDATISDGAAGDTVRLLVSGTDGRTAASSSATIWYIRENDARLTRLGAVTGTVVQTDGARVLYADSAGGMHIRTLATGAVVNLPTSSGEWGWRLTPHGALFLRGFALAGGTVHEWRNGTVVDAGAISFHPEGHGYGVYPIMMEGGWAVWASPQGLVRRDLEAGTNTVVAAGGLALYFAGWDNYDVAASGDVAYARQANSSAPIEIVRSSVGTVLTGRSIGKPRTDGVNVIASTDSAFVLAGPAGVDTLVKFNPTAGVYRDYDVKDGWAAWTRIAGSQVQVWLRSPAGTDYNASALFDVARIRALGPGGQLVFAASRRLWLYTGGGQPVDIASVDAQSFWHNGELYVVLNGIVFRVQR